MVKTFYEEMRTVAQDVFGEFKQGVIRYVESETAAGVTPDEPGSVTVTYTTLNATARPVSRQYVDGTQIIGVETEVSFAAGSVVPTVEGSIEIDGSTYKIVRVMQRPAAGTAVSYTVIVKR
jgi:hypothetical protein